MSSEYIVSLCTPLTAYQQKVLKALGESLHLFVKSEGDAIWTIENLLKDVSYIEDGAWKAMQSLGDHEMSLADPSFSNRSHWYNARTSEKSIKGILADLESRADIKPISTAQASPIAKSTSGISKKPKRKKRAGKANGPRMLRRIETLERTIAELKGDPEETVKECDQLVTDDL